MTCLLTGRRVQEIREELTTAAKDIRTKFEFHTANLKRTAGKVRQRIADSTEEIKTQIRDDLLRPRPHASRD